MTKLRGAAVALLCSCTAAHLWLSYSKILEGMSSELSFAETVDYSNVRCVVFILCIYIPDYMYI